MLEIAIVASYSIRFSVMIMHNNNNKVNSLLLFIISFLFLIIIINNNNTANFFLQLFQTIGEKNDDDGSIAIAASQSAAHFLVVSIYMMFYHQPIKLYASYFLKKPITRMANAVRSLLRTDSLFRSIIAAAEEISQQPQRNTHITILSCHGNNFL